MKGNSRRRFSLFRLAFRSSPTTGHTTPSIESHAAPILSLSPPASPPPLRPPILQTEAIPEPLQSQPGSSENLSVLQDEDNVDSIGNNVSYDPEYTGLPPMDALFKLSKDFPHSPEGAAKVLAIVFGMRDERLARKRRAEKRIKHVTLQREMWEAELENAEEEYGRVVKSTDVVTVEHLARKQLAEKVTKYVTLQREMWEAELEEAQKDCGRLMISMGVVMQDPR